MTKETRQSSREGPSATAVENTAILHVSARVHKTGHVKDVANEDILLSSVEQRWGMPNRRKETSTSRWYTPERMLIILTQMMNMYFKGLTNAK